MLLVIMLSIFKMNLRPYQVRTLEQLDTWFAANPDGNPIVSACVGAGKSIMIAEFCRRAVLDYPDYRTRILMLVPSKELLIQNIGKLSHLTQDINIGIVSASLCRKDTAFDKDVVIATVGSVAKNPGQLGRLEIILVDECHLINRKETGQYRKLIADCQRYNPDLRVIGLTGTPFRGNGIWLTEGKERLFTDIAARVTMTELLDSGFLSPLVTADTGIQVSASEVRQSNGDYVVAELEKLLDDSELTKNIAKTIVSLGKDRNRWLVYGVTVAHATHLCEAINALGIRAEVVSAQTPAKERGRIINDFKRGKLRCLCNVAVLTTGFDVPELDLIALVRNTKSPVLYTQVCLDDETEILSASGWKRRGEIKIGDIVAGFDMQTGLAKWQTVLSCVNRDIYNGERLVSIDSPHLNLCVTDNHNLVIKSRRAKKWMLQKASDAMKRLDQSWLPVSADMGIQDCSLYDSEAEFIGWFLTDGCLNKKTNAIQISQRSTAKENLDIVSVLNGCGFRYGKTVIQRNGVVFNNDARKYDNTAVYSISHGDARIANGTGLKGWNRLSEWINKDIPDAFNLLSKRQLWLMLSAMNKANGRKSTQTDWIEKTWEICVGHREKMADRIQALCITRGIRCNVSKRKDGQLFLLVSDKQVATIRGKTVHDNNSNAVLKYDDHSSKMVWCVETPMGTLFTRRRGKAVIVGNCGRGMRIADGKTDCLWLDFTDTTANMGPVDCVKGRGEPKAKDEPVDAPFKICPGCGSKLGTTALQCPVCGQEFDPSKPAINDTLSDASILSKAVFNTYPVQRVTYAYHKNLKNQDKPPTLKVTYWSYVNPIISEWVCLEHSGYAQAKAIRWWQSRSDVPMPLSIDEFFDFNLADSLRQPVSITVKEGGEWPELIRCHFEHEPETIA